MSRPDESANKIHAVFGTAIAFVLAVVMAMSLAACGQAGQPSTSNSAAAASSASGKSAASQTAIEYWNPDSAAMRSIVEFVSASVDPNSSGYIPKEDRIAVFDMDGTLYGERFPTTSTTGSLSNVRCMTVATRHQII